MASIHLPCPVCGEEMEIEMEWENGDYSIGLFSGWQVRDFIAKCGCPLTDLQEQGLINEAEHQANTNPEFGITLTLREEGGF